MGRAERRIWLAADAAGMLAAAIGAASYVGALPMGLGEAASLVVLGIGAILILESLIFVGIEGARVDREVEEHNRLDAIRADSYNVPDDLHGGYLIDYTAEPSRAVRYENDPEPEREPPAVAGGDPLPEPDPEPGYLSEEWYDDEPALDGWLGEDAPEPEPAEAQAPAEAVARIGGGRP
ncbi:MAG: hypothetical protein LBG62_01785 [Candidatus Methanoplasma sp.]|jgi:hypothetical protein|nr:hypothetical protein [Candidatus Methanoplasma sp.]